jgi:hypothetical protein
VSGRRALPRGLKFKFKEPLGKTRTSPPENLYVLRVYIDPDTLTVRNAFPVKRQGVSMIVMQYPRSGRYAAHGKEYDQAVDLATVSQGDLCWYYFLSDLSFRIGDVDLSPPWSWTPVFHFLWSVKGVLEHLESGEWCRIGFTENAELIEFDPRDDATVRVSCSYVPEVAVCPIAELKDAWLALRQDVLTELSGEYPRLAANPVLAGLSLQGAS